MKKRWIHTHDVRTHPALRAWVRATSLDATPDCIHVYRERTRRGLYRLPAVAPGGASVFAKRALAHRTRIERTVYRDVLPHLPLEAPRYYGSWLDEVYGWLFVEDVGTERYSERDPEHLALAGRWVAALHAGAAGIPAARSLPDAGLARYLAHLRSGRNKIALGLRVQSFPPDEVEGLEAVLSHCDAIEARWSRLEAASHDSPSTLVHGDFRAKNAYLRRSGGALRLVPIDWETAGWGFPAPDLTRIDLRAYWSVARDAWPRVGFDVVEACQRTGRVLEELAAVDWVAESLKCEGARARSWAVKDLAVVLRRLDLAARAARVLD